MSACLLVAEALEPREVPAAPFDTLPTFNFTDPAMSDHVRSITAFGSTYGRRTDAFMKVGDSNSSPLDGFAPGYLLPLGSAAYNPTASGLAAHPELLDTLAVYRTPLTGTSDNSFTRVSTAAFPGATVGDVLGRIGTEVAATDAGVALVMIGTNDAFVYTDLATFRARLQMLVTGLAGSGVVPVLSTIPDNLYQGGAFVTPARRLNQVIADVAADDYLPLWNLWRDLHPLPGSGLDQYGVHLSASPAGGGNFSALDLQFGQNVRNLEALQVLDWFQKQVVVAPPTAAAPFASWTPLTRGESVYAVGSGEGQGPSVRVYDATTKQEVNRFLSFDRSFAGGVRVAVADVNGDAIPDVIVAPGAGGGPAVKVFSGADGSPLASFFAFDPQFRGGVSSIDAADLDGDGKAEIAVGAGVGGGPVVAVFHGGDFGEVQRFFAFDPGFRGGVNVALGTFAGIGPSIVAGAGVGGGPAVELFAFGATSPVTSFFADDLAYSGGVVLAAGDLDGDGFDELAIGRAFGGKRVQVIDPMSRTEKRSFLASPDDGPAGVRLAMLSNGSGPAQLLIGSASGEAVSVQAYPGLSGDAVQLPPNDTSRAFGVYVG